MCETGITETGCPEKMPVKIRTGESGYDALQSSDEG